MASIWANAADDDEPEEKAAAMVRTPKATTPPTTTTMAPLPSRPVFQYPIFLSSCPQCHIPLEVAVPSPRPKQGTLLDVQWTYLAITMFSVALALLFYYMPLPEVSDAELERSTKRLAVDPRKSSVGGIKLRTVSETLKDVIEDHKKRGWLKHLEA